MHSSMRFSPPNSRRQTMALENLPLAQRLETHIGSSSVLPSTVGRLEPIHLPNIPLMKMMKHSMIQIVDWRTTFPRFLSSHDDFETKISLVSDSNPIFWINRCVFVLICMIAVCIAPPTPPIDYW